MRISLKRVQDSSQLHLVPWQKSGPTIDEKRQKPMIVGDSRGLRGLLLFFLAAIIGALFQVSPMYAQTPILIDFEGLAPGTNVTELTVDGLTITVDATGGIGQAWVFDSSAPTGGDEDLGTPNENCTPAGPGVGTGGVPGTPGENCVALGNILIIQENDNGIPDDAATGGTLTFTFSEAVIVKHFDLLDFEETTTPSITFYDENNQQLGTPISPIGYGDNSYEQFNPEVDAGVFEVVTTIVMDLPISGAIGGIEVVRAAEVIDMGKIGDTIFCQDTGEPLPNVLVTLTPDDGPVQTQSTDASGLYIFENLPLGGYTVSVDPSTIAGSCNIPAVDPDGVLDNTSTVTLTIESVVDLDQDFGYSAPAVDPVGSIGDTIYCVTTGEPLANVLVTLTSETDAPQTLNTDVNGNYLFTNLPLGDYIVTVDPTTIAGSCTVPAIDPDGVLDNTSSVTLTADAPDNLDQDFAYSVPAVDPLGSIGDTIFCDINDNGSPDVGEGIAGVTVTLGGTASETATTDANGNYLFPDLGAGDYTVTVDTATLPATCNVPAVDPDGGTDSTSALTLATGENNLDQDFGYVAPPIDPILGSIGDTIFCDVNNNGSPDAGEGIAGVTVTLGGTASETATTDANGNYLFFGLSAGDYSVTVDITTLPATCNVPAVDPDGGTDSTSTVTLGEGEDNLDQDFGYVAPSVDPVLGSIGDTIFCDANGNGSPDAGEGMPGVTVTLGGAASATTTTDATGIYLFSNLSAGDYTVTVDTATLPTTCNVPTVDPDGGTDSTSTVTLGEGEDNLDQDFGFVPSTEPALGSIGDTIFCDANNNGAFDAGEGLAGILVTLGGSATASTTTLTEGRYLFENLEAGDYTITIDPFSIPESCNVASIDPDGGNDNQSSLTLGEGEDNLDQDFGFIASTGSELFPQLTLTKQVANTVVSRGDSLIYSLEYANIGDADAEDVQLNEGIPEGTTYDPENSSPGWVCTGTVPGSSCTLDIGTLPANTAGDPVQFAVRIDTDLPEEINRIECAATLSSSTPNPGGSATTSTATPITPGAPDNLDTEQEPKSEVRVFLPLFQ